MSSYVCAECGLDYDTISPSDAKVAIRSFPRRYRSALAGAIEDDADAGLIRRRPDEGTWSALEYAAHVADVFGLFSTVLTRMFEQDAPRITEFWDPDDRAAAQGYNDKDPAATLVDLEAAATKLATSLDRFDGDAWSRLGTFDWGERDLLTMTRNAVHEGSHHLRDVDRVLEAARRR